MDLEQLKRILIITRPIFWPLYPILFLIGLNLGGGILNWKAWLEILMLTFPAALLTYGINDAYDVRADSKNPRKKNIVEGFSINQSDAEQIKKLAPLAIVALVLSSILTTDIVNIVLMILFSLSMYFYSSPPFRLKEKPPFDSLINGFFYFFAPFALGYSFGAPLSEIEPRFALLLTTCAIGLHTLAAITDYEPDKKVNNNTIAVWLGPRGAALFALVFFSVNLVFSWQISIELMILVFITGALTNLITLKYAKPVMGITILWGIITTINYFIEKILIQ